MTGTTRQKAGGTEGFLTRLRRDRRGISGVEFALLAPVVISLYFGLAELCQGYMCQKRMGHTASAVADMVAQTDLLNKAQLDDIIGVGSLIMKPFSTSGLTTRVSSVTRDANGVAKVDWSHASSGVDALLKDATVIVPEGVIANGQSLIMSETTYDYSSPIKYVLKRDLEFSSVFYLRPRRVEKVECTDCPKT